MAVLTPVAADVKPVQSPTYQTYTAGATIARGDLVYLDATDNKVKLADNTSVATAACVGFAQTPAVLDEIVTVQRTGRIDLGAATVKTTDYYVSSTAGRVEPYADITGSDYVTRVAYAIDTDVLQISIFATGLQA